MQRVSDRGCGDRGRALAGGDDNKIRFTPYGMSVVVLGLPTAFGLWLRECQIRPDRDSAAYPVPVHKTVIMLSQSLRFYYNGVL